MYRSRVKSANARQIRLLLILLLLLPWSLNQSALARRQRHVLKVDLKVDLRATKATLHMTATKATRKEGTPGTGSRVSCIRIRVVDVVKVALCMNATIAIVPTILSARV